MDKMKMTRIQTGIKVREILRDDQRLLKLAVENRVIPSGEQCLTYERSLQLADLVLGVCDKTEQLLATASIHTRGPRAVSLTNLMIAPSCPADLRIYGALWTALLDWCIQNDIDLIFSIPINHRVADFHRFFGFVDHGNRELINYSAIVSRLLQSVHDTQTIRPQILTQGNQIIHFGRHHLVSIDKRSGQTTLHTRGSLQHIETRSLNESYFSNFQRVEDHLGLLVEKASGQLGFPFGCRMLAPWFSQDAEPGYVFPKFDHRPLKDLSLLADQTLMIRYGEPQSGCLEIRRINSTEWKLRVKAATPDTRIRVTLNLPPASRDLILLPRSGDIWNRSETAAADFIHIYANSSETELGLRFSDRGANHAS